MRCLPHQCPPLHRVTFTPTVEHCSMATLIGLCIRVKLLRVLPTRFKARLGRVGGMSSQLAAGDLVSVEAGSVAP